MEYTDMERRILDMWPKFEDGTYVMLGDKAIANSGENSGKEFTVRNVYFESAHGKLRSSALDGCYWNWKAADPYVKRPAPKVLDADGVPIKVGDTVWHEDGRELRVIGFDAMQDGETVLIVEYAAEPTKLGEVRSLSLTHTRPAPKVLDADGVEIHVGDTVYGVGRSQHSFDVLDSHHIDPKVGEAFSVRCYDRREGEECHCRPELLTHDLPDSWERLEEDATMSAWSYRDKYGLAVGVSNDEYIPTTVAFALDLIRRAKALAKKEAAR